jgi:hypothetical protein
LAWPVPPARRIRSSGFGRWGCATIWFAFFPPAHRIECKTFIERNIHAIVEFPMAAAGSRSVDPFFNINSTKDLEEAEAIWKAWGQ